MTRSTPEPDSAAADPSAVDDARSPAWSDVDDLDAAELEAREDDADRERQQGRSALIGLVALVLVILLAGFGFWASVSQVQQQDQPAPPGIGRQLPPQPAP